MLFIYITLYAALSISQSFHCLYAALISDLDPPCQTLLLKWSQPEPLLVPPMSLDGDGDEKLGGAEWLGVP